MRILKCFVTATLVVATSASVAHAQPRLADDTVLTGDVRTNGASSVVDVVAYAWPSNERLHALSTGARVDVVPVARVRSDSGGHFSLHLTPRDIDSSHRGVDGRVDLDVFIASRDRQTEWQFTAMRSHAHNAVWTVSGGDAGDVAPQAAIHVDLGRSPSIVEAHQSVVGPRPRIAVAPRNDVIMGARAFGLAAPDGDTPHCNITAGGYINKNDETFLSVYAWSGALATVHEAVTDDHTLGVAAQSTGGTFSASGALTIDINHGNEAERGGVADANVHNLVNYRIYNYSPSGVPQACNGVKLQQRPDGPYGLLTNYTYAGSTTFPYCVHYTGGSVTKSNGKNVTYSVGVSLPAISVSAQSGYTSGTTLTYTITAPTYYCGNSSQGPVQSSQVETHGG